MSRETLDEGKAILPSKNVGGFFPSLIVSVYVQYHFVEALMSDYIAPAQGRKRKYGSLFFTGLLGGLGILLGTLLLIVPGIFLMARWAISTPFVVAEGMRGYDSLKASWRATEKARWPLFFVFMAGCGGFFVLFLGVVIVAAGFHVLADTSLPLKIAGNLLGSALVIGGWTLGVAIYRCVKPSQGTLLEVFD